jgi:hypothetical protein
MAKSRTNVAATSNGETSPLPSEALQNALARITQDASQIQSLNQAADEASSGRGYPDAVLASKRMGLDWEAFSNWVPAKTGAKDPGDGERMIRTLHAVANPATSPEAEAVLKHALQLVVDASSPEVSKAANEATRMVPARTPNVVKSQALKDLTALRDEARANGDDATAEMYGKHLDAIDDKNRMLVLANGRGALSTKAKRFRARLTLHLISDLIDSYAGAKAGSVYQAIADHALSTLRTFQQNTDGQDRTPDKLRGTVRGETERKLAEQFKHVARTATDPEVMRANAVKTFFRGLNAMHEHEVISEDTWIKIKNVLRTGANILDPEQAKIQEANAKRKATQPEPVTTSGKRKVATLPTPPAKPAKAAAPTAPAAKRPLPAPPPSARKPSTDSLKGVITGK